MSLTDIRDGIALNLATISGLRTSAELEDMPNPPQAVIQVNNITYDQAFAKGLVEYNFTVTVIVGRVSDRIAQRRLNAYASTGEGGIKHAIESDKTLGGYAFDVRVPEMTSFGTVTLGDSNNYLAAEFTVNVYSN